jgi:L-lactate dehydrogenase complex protein LldG
VDSRTEILKRLRDAAPPAAPLPDPRGELLPYADPLAQLEIALQAVAAVPVRVADEAALAEAVRKLVADLGAQRVASAVPAAGAGNVRPEALPDPHQLEGIDLAILPGAFGVAENGAIWVNAATFPHRGVFVVTQHLAIVLPAREVVTDMHAAYERVAALPRAYGLFIAGPSKTADIEQALVIGAHGARSCTVFLLG